MSRDILIAGAGIGGLTAAIALGRAGHRVRVFEQAAALGELGAGLTVTAPAMAAFAAIGLWDEVRRIIVRSTGMAFVHYRTAELLHGTIDHEWTRMPDAPGQGGQTHRAMLHALLADRLRAIDPGALHLGHRLTGLEQDGTGVTLRFANGASATGDLFVGADGIRSTAYRAMFGHDQPATYTGVVAVRCMVPRARAEPFIGGGRSLRYVAPGRGFSRYGVRRGELINCIALARHEGWTEEGWTQPCSKAELRALYADFHPDVLGLIDQAPDVGIFRWALYDRDPLPGWTSGRATLLGDAAHPMLPYLAQGATAAIEDAIVLARALTDFADIDEALRRYQAARIPRTSHQMFASRRQEEALNQPDPYAYPARRANLEEILSYDPATVEL